MTRTAPYRLSTAAQPTVAEAHILLGVRHGVDTQPVAHWEVCTGLPHLAGPPREWWLSEAPVRQLAHDGVALRANDAVGFGHLSLAEDALRADCAGTCESAFVRLLAAQRAAGLPHLLRSWIYLGDIHAGSGDAERYRQFCIGRSRALAAAGLEPSSYSAATVIGRPGGGASIHFMAASRPATAVENPRQTSAFDYPRRYGPSPPSFVRAQRTDWDALLVSGTAAVVGADSLHPGAIGAQIREIGRNLAALLAAAGGDWAPARGVVYLREAGDVPQVEGLPLGEAVTVLQGRICRPELLVEAEAIYQRPVGD